MQKNIAITAALLVGIFIGVFSVSALNRRARHKPVASVKTEQPTKPEASAPKEAEEKPLFYTSVGGSSPSADSPSSTARVSTRYTIELATVKSQADAESMLIRLKDRGLDGFYTPVRRGGQVLFHVRIGMFSNADDASQNLKKIAARANIQGRVAKLH